MTSPVSTSTVSIRTDILVLIFILFLAVLHSELTTQRQVTPKKIKKENKTVVDNRHQPHCLHDPA